MQVKETTGPWTQTVRKCLTMETSAARGRERQIMRPQKRSLHLPPPYHLTPRHQSPAQKFPEYPAVGLVATVLSSLLPQSLPLTSATSCVMSRTPCYPLLLLSLMLAPPHCTCRYRRTPPLLLLHMEMSPLSHLALWCLSGTPAAPHLTSTPPCITLLLPLSSRYLSQLPQTTPPLLTHMLAHPHCMSTCRRPLVSIQSSRRPNSSCSFRPSVSHSFMVASLMLPPSSLWFSSSDINQTGDTSGECNVFTLRTETFLKFVISVQVDVCLSHSV